MKPLEEAIAYLHRDTAHDDMSNEWLKQRSEWEKYLEFMYNDIGDRLPTLELVAYYVSTNTKEPTLRMRGTIKGAKFNVYSHDANDVSRSIIMALEEARCKRLKTIPNPNHTSWTVRMAVAFAIEDDIAPHIAKAMRNVPGKERALEIINKKRDALQNIKKEAAKVRVKEALQMYSLSIDDFTEIWKEFQVSQVHNS